MHMGVTFSTEVCRWFRFSSATFPGADLLSELSLEAEVLVTRGRLWGEDAYF